MTDSTIEILDTIYALLASAFIIYVMTRENRDKILKSLVGFGAMHVLYYSFFEQWTAVIMGLGSLANSILALRRPKNNPGTLVTTAAFFCPAFANYLMITGLWTDVLYLVKVLIWESSKRLRSRYRLGYLLSNILAIWFGIATGLRAPLFMGLAMLGINTYFLATRGFEKVESVARQSGEISR